MGRFRDIKRSSRLVVHQTMCVQALYIPVVNATPVPCTVRVWTKTDPMQVGDLSGLQGSATLGEPEDRIRFLRSELPAFIRTNAVFSVEAGEAYRIELLYPEDDQFQTARVVRLTAAEAAGLPVPA